VSGLVLVPPLQVGALSLFVNSKLPVLLYDLLEKRLPSTRIWIKDEVTTWLQRDDPSENCRMFVVLGDGGTGKSVISAMLVDELLRADILVGAVHC